MRITLVTPAKPRSRAGNRATATRWARFLRAAGHRVRLETDYDGHDADLMIALHAWRSAEAIRAFSEVHHRKPLIVVLTGTDIYRFQYSHGDTTLASMDRAHALIALHNLVDRDIPARFRSRLHTVLQSAEPLPSRLPPLKSRFEVCVAGHLREEKDSLRAALAIRDVPTDSRLKVLLVGRAHDDSWAAEARREMAANPRFTWRGEVPHWQVRRLMARARLMVISSIMEGGANIVSEACVAGLPVVASEIPGNVGLLGEDYPGYYPARDTDALRECLLRAESDGEFLASLRRRCEQRADSFRPAAEQAALLKVIRHVTGHPA